MLPTETKHSLTLVLLTRWRGVVISLCCLSIVGCGPTPPEPQTGITIEIKRPPVKLGVDLFLCLDESGSMLTTDPTHLRHEAGKYLIQNLLVKEADPSHPHRIAVIPFDDRAYGGDLTDLRPAKATELAHQIAAHQPTPQGNTSFIEALRRVRRSLDQAPSYPQPRRTVVVIFTDGEPDDTRNLPLAAYFNELNTYLQDSLGRMSLYVIGLDQTPDQSRFGRTVAAWRELAGEDHVILLRNLDDLYLRFNDTIRRVFELPESPTDVLSARQERAFEVMPYLSRMEIHAFSDQELRLRLLRPDGSLVESGQPGIEIGQQPGYRIITIQDPTPGLWRYQTEGEGQVKVFRNEVPLRMTLLSPQSVHPLGKPIQLKAEFVTASGDLIRELPAFPLKFTARILSPDRTEETAAEFTEKVGSVYYVNREAPTNRPGAYTIEIEIHGGQRFKTKHTETVEVREFPYFTLDAPSVLSHHGFADALEIAGHLSRQSATTDPVKEYQTNPNSLILAQIVSSPGGQRSDAQIRAIATGNVQPGTATEYIARWLPRPEAAKISLPVNPEAGFGGQRAAGHAYIYTDITRLRQLLEQAYNRVKQLQGAESQRGSRVIGVLVGSQSGGTGAGLLWDIAVMLRAWTMARLDSLYVLLPLANSYQALATSEARKLEINAKNYAGLLNLLRFMAISGLPATFEYSTHDIFHCDTNLVECPFLLDGDNVSCKLNDVVPNLGVVPAMADWLLTLIKDDLAGTNHIAASDSINWPNYISSDDPHQRFASLGTSTIRYPWKEVLQTFKPRFAWWVFEEMLKPSGPLAGEGSKRAQQVLDGSPFGVMINRGSVDLALKAWKTP